VVSKASSMKTLIRSFCLTLATGLVMQAGSFAFSAQDGTATASITTNANSVSITLTNLLANPLSAASLLSDLFFSVCNGGSALTSGSVASSSANLIAVNAGGTVTPGANNASLGWGLSNTAGVFHLNGLSGTNTPSDLIIGAAGPGGVYTNANASLAGNGPHNPFANQTATFTLTIAGALASSTISNVVFSYGTTAGVNVPGVPTLGAAPEPASVLMLGTLIAGALWMKSRRSAISVE